MSLNSPARVSLRTIVAATDFSPCSEVTLQYAANLASKIDALLIVAHVVQPEHQNGASAVAEVRESAEQQMTDLEASEQLEGVRHKTFIGDGDTANVLANLALSHNADLIIVGTHGRTGIRKLVLGSVAKQVLAQAHCPVLTVGPNVCAETRREARFTHILYATDFTRENETVLPYACAFAVQHRAALTLMHVVAGNPTGNHEESVLEARAKLLDSVPGDFSEILTPEIVVEVGSPAELILKAAETRHVDLILIGPHHPGALHADTAYNLMVEAACPVLSVPEVEHARVAAVP